jgi:PAS domain S-box-containing protein
MSAIKLKTNGYKEAVFNKHLVEIIDNIISAYPLTFVNLERLRKEIDGLEELFWIKDEGGKYLLVNNTFSSSLHFATSQIEGKPVDKFIPGYLLNFNKALDEYIKESRSVFIIEGFPFAGVSSRKDYQTIEIPVTDSEDNVVAIIGVTQKVSLKPERKENIDFSAQLSLIKSLNKDFVFIDSNGTVTEVSNGFCNLFSLSPSQVKSNNYRVLPQALRSLIESFQESGAAFQTVDVNDKGVTESEVSFHFIKINGSGIIILSDSKEVPELLTPNADNETKTYDVLIQNNSKPVFIYDKSNLRFLQVNNAALKLYGYSRDEFLQLDLTDLYAPDDIQTLLDKNSESHAEDHITKPYRQKHKDGTTIFVELSTVRVKYNDKDAVFNVIRNVADELKLKKESQLYNSLYKNSSNLFFVTDREGFIKSVNKAVIETLGYSPKSLEESSFTSLAIDEERGKINSSVFQSGLKEKLSFKTFLKRAGSNHLEVELISNPVFDYKGEIDSYCIICIKIEEKVKEVIKEIVKEIPVQFNVGKEDFPKAVPETIFLSGVFHDLLTPINVILGFVEDLTENIELSKPGQKEAVEIINQNRSNLLNSMNSIIELTQISKNQVEMKYDFYKIGEIIENLKSEMEEDRTLENIELAFGKISSSLEIRTDSNKFQKLLTVILNIISKISSQKKMYISVSPLNEEFFGVYFRDEYSSSSEEFAGRLNSVFESNNLESGVSLLTLNLCNSLMQLLEGEFKVFEENDGGFVFPIDLTKRVKSSKNKVEADDNVIEEEEVKPITKFEEVTFLKEPQSKEPISLKQPMDISGLRCLYIEDQPDSQMLFSVEMKDLKEINFASGFEQALPLLKSKHFDFIVMDINLKGDYNGLDILRIIRTMPGYENVPVVAVTAYLLPGDTDKFIHAGFSDFVSKPVFREKILASLEKTLV